MPSASSSAFQFCALENPVAGNYWVLPNRQGSGWPVRFLRVSATQVNRNNQSASFTVTGPGSATLGAPFDLALQWS